MHARVAWRGHRRDTARCGSLPRRARGIVPGALRPGRSHPPLLPERSPVLRRSGRIGTRGGALPRPGPRRSGSAPSPPRRRSAAAASAAFTARARSSASRRSARSGMASARAEPSPSTVGSPSSRKVRNRGLDSRRLRTVQRSSAFTRSSSERSSAWAPGARRPARGRVGAHSLRRRDPAALTAPMIQVGQVAAREPGVEGRSPGSSLVRGKREAIRGAASREDGASSVGRRAAPRPSRRRFRRPGEEGEHLSLARRRTTRPRTQRRTLP